MPDTYDRERAVALDAVRSAARLCQTVQADIDSGVMQKEDRTPVTVADFGSQALICKVLQDQFPADPVIAEEDSEALAENEEIFDAVVDRVGAEVASANRPLTRAWIDHGNAESYSDRFWTLDPIDGTKGFVRGDQYAIALALIVDGRPQVAALACPNLPSRFGTDDPSSVGQAFLAVRGQGTMQVPLDADSRDAPVEIQTSDVADAAEGRFTESFVSSHSSHDMAVQVGNRLGIDDEPLRIDSQAKYAVVARGSAEIYFRLPRPGSTYVEKIWDHAAGSLVVEAAGGTVTDMHGEPLDWTHAPLLSENEGIVATNGRFHEDVLAALNEEMEVSRS
jgi:3'(2'), 5'-bisphosphate nucleotidase